MPAGGCLRVDLAVAFVGEDQEAEAPRERGEALQIGAIGDRALRVGRRGEIEGDGAREQLLVQRVEIGQEAGLGGRRQIDRLAIGGGRAGRIGGIERIGDQDRGRPARPRTQRLARDGGEEQAFARAVEHQDFGLRVDGARQPEAPAEPAGGGAAKRLGALVGRIAAEIGEMGGEHRPDERRDRMLRLADRQVDRRLARLARRPSSSLSRTNGERAYRPARAGRRGTRSAVVMYIGCKRRTHRPHKGFATIGAARLRPD